MSARRPREPGAAAGNPLRPRSGEAAWGLRPYFASTILPTPRQAEVSKR